MKSLPEIVKMNREAAPDKNLKISGQSGLLFEDSTRLYPGSESPATKLHVKTSGDGDLDYHSYDGLHERNQSGVPSVEVWTKEEIEAANKQAEEWMPLLFPAEDQGGGAEVEITHEEDLSQPEWDPPNGPCVLIEEAEIARLTDVEKSHSAYIELLEQSEVAHLEEISILTAQRDFLSKQRDFASRDVVRLEEVIRQLRSDLAQAREEIAGLQDEIITRSVAVRGHVADLTAQLRRYEESGRAAGKRIEELEDWQRRAVVELDSWSSNCIMFPMSSCRDCENRLRCDLDKLVREATPHPAATEQPEEK